MLRAFVVYPFLAVSQIAINLFVWATAWLWSLLSVIMGWQNLPGILENLQTLDNPLDAMTPGGAGAFKRWYYRMRWLMRNPAQGFGMRVLGLPVAGTTFETLAASKGPITWTGQKTDWQFNKLTTANGRDYFEFRMSLKVSFSTYIKIWLGWQTYSYDGEHYLLRIEFQPRDIIQ